MPLRVCSILVAAMAANIYIPVAPSILGALVDYQGLSNDVAGRLISYNFWGATFSTVLAIFILHRPGWDLRLTMLACALLVIISSGASVWMADNTQALAVVRFANGIGAGLGLTVGAVALVGTPHVERWYAILYGSPFLISGAGLAFLPFVYQKAGIEGAFYGMGALNLLACCLLPFFPRHVGQGDRSAEPAKSPVDNPLILLPGLVLAALFLHYLFNSGIWTYFERLGVAYGMSAQRAGAILGPSMSAAIVGMVVASVLGGRLGYLRPIYIGTLVLTVSTVALLFSSSELVFGVGTALFNACITFVTPYFFALLASLIPSGLGVSAGNIATMAGFSTGPFLVSFLVANDDFRSSIVLTAVGFLFVCAIVMVFSRALQKSKLGRERLAQLVELPRAKEMPQ